MASGTPSTADISEMVRGWLPEPSVVQTRYQYADDTYRVDFETCGEHAHFFISADPQAWRHEGVKQVVDGQLHDIWSRPSQPPGDVAGVSTC